MAPIVCNSWTCDSSAARSSSTTNRRCVRPSWRQWSSLRAGQSCGKGWGRRNDKGRRTKDEGRRTKDEDEGRITMRVRRAELWLGLPRYPPQDRDDLAETAFDGLVLAIGLPALAQQAEHRRE